MYFGIISPFVASEILPGRMFSYLLTSAGAAGFLEIPATYLDLFVGIGGNAAPGAIPDIFELFGERSGDGIIETQIYQPEHAPEKAVGCNCQIKIDNFPIFDTFLYHFTHYGKRS
jgi:hypothetical protein